MTLSQIVASPSARITAVMSLLFCGFGINLPYLPRWLAEERSLTGIEIATVLSSAQLARIVVGPLIAAWADGFKDRGTPIKLLALGSLAAYAGFYLMEGFLGLVLIGFAATTIVQAIVPLAEGGALRASLRPDGLPYGKCRAVGSGAFIVGNISAGAIVGVFGVAIAPALALATLTLTNLAAWFGLKPDPAPPRAAAMGFAARLKLGAGLLRNPRFAFTLAAASCVQASHAFYYGFTAIVWKDQGVPDLAIGLLFSFGVLVEIALLAMLTRVEKRFEPHMLIVIGAAAAIVRWSCFAFSPPMPVLFALQALHALTFAATHVGAMRLIQREAPEEVSGLAQTLYAALAAGLFMGLAGLGAGILFDLGGAYGYLAMAGLGAIALALITPVAMARV